MRASKETTIRLMPDVATLATSPRKLKALTDCAMELLCQYAPCVEAAIMLPKGSKVFYILLCDEKGNYAHQFEVKLKNEGTRSELTKIGVED